MEPISPRNLFDSPIKLFRGAPGLTGSPDFSSNEYLLGVKVLSPNLSVVSEAATQRLPISPWTISYTPQDSGAFTEDLLSSFCGSDLFPQNAESLEIEYPELKDIPDKGCEHTLSRGQLLRMRASQNTVKHETNGGITLEDMQETFEVSGWDDSKPPLRVVLMPGSLDDSPSARKKDLQNIKAVAYDNRRFTAAKRCAKKQIDPKVKAILYSVDSPAVEEFKALESLALQNTFAGRIKERFQTAWTTWNDDDLLRKNNILKGSWGHCIKIRMAMGGVQVADVFGQSGLPSTPMQRKASPAFRPVSALSRPSSSASSRLSSPDSRFNPYRRPFSSSPGLG